LKGEYQRLKLLIAYDGRPFRGWQSQASRDAVQDFVEAAFAKIVGQRVAVHGSGRTDAGVHALGQVAHADVPRDQLPLAQWTAALNANLPPAIRVLRTTRTADDFHARFDACGKTYLYRIWNGPVFHPLEIGRAWHMPPALDLAVLRTAAALFVGTHDFASFAANRRQPAQDTVRSIHSVTVTQRGPFITLRFEGSGFLYKMVRLLTGTLVRCAQHRAEPALISGLLAHPGVKKAQFCAPAEGLYLARVRYAARSAH
jgi:tRNA pseudouridine38-40 synthase